MHEAVWPLGSWEVFYLIIGASAAALIGLQFVVIAVGADSDTLGGTEAIHAFATPTIVHFGAVLLISAVVTAPWHGPRWPAIGLGLTGAAGILYGLVVVRRARIQTFYVPDLEDWTWHGALPLVAHVTLITGAILFPSHAETALFWIGAAVVLLLFIGIHNAWDSVIYIARGRKADSENTATSVRVEAPASPVAMPRKD